MRLLPILVVMLTVGLVLPLFLTLGSAEYTTPIVWSNKKEYDPSETAYLYGYGFNVLSQINISIIRPDLVEDKMQTSTDEFGYFSCQYLLDGIHGTFTVTATDGVNIATTTFDNWLYLNAWWNSADSIHIYAEASGLSSSKSYYIKYFDPSSVERRKSPTYTGVTYMNDNLTILPTFPNILGTWTVKLYENNVWKKTKTVSINKIVWTTDSTYANLVTSFAQGETVYFKTIGLQTSKYYRFKLEMSNGTMFYVGSWTTGVTQMTGSYVLPSNAPIGTWKVHVREASDSSGTCEHQYVDCCFQVTTTPPPTQYYLTVRTDPTGIGTIPGQGWYNACTYVNLTAPEFFPGSTGTRYRFNYWDVDGTTQGAGVYEISVHMNVAHIATAHYITQYFLNLTTNPPGVTTPAGVGWYDTGTNVPIFAPEFISIEVGASRYRFNGWTTGNMSEIANPSAMSTIVFLDEPKTVTANYVMQYHLTVVSSYGTPSGEGWYDSGDTAYAMLDTNIVNHGNSTRRVFTSWGGDASGTNYASSDPIVMNAAKTATANWKTEYQLTVRTSGLGTYTTNVYNGTAVLGTATDATPYTDWFAKDSSILLNIDSPIADGSKRFVFTQWSGDATGTTRPTSVPIDTVKDITANYKTQYEITVTASPGGALGGTFKVTYTQCGTTYTNVLKTTSWTEWADASTTVTVSEPQDIISVSPGMRYKFDYYTPSASVTVDQARTITLVYKTQYYLTVETSPAEVLTLDPAAVLGEGWYDSGSTATVDAVQNVDKVAGQSQYDFRSWTGATPTGVGNQATVLMDNSKTATANYKLQYKITFNQSGVGGDFGDTVVIIDSTNNYGVGSLPKWFWWDDGSTHTFAFQSPLVVGPTSKQYVWTSTTGLSTLQSDSIIISAFGSVTGNYKTQYYLNLATNPPDITSPSGTGWYDAGTYADISTPEYVSGGSRYHFQGWVTADMSEITDPDSPSTTVLVDESKTVTANYVLQYLVTFTHSGLAADASGTVVTVNGTSKTYGGLPYDLWVDENDILFYSYETSVPSTTPGKRFALVSVTGPSSPITVTADMTVTGNYKTQYQVTVTASPSGALGGTFKVTYTQCGTTYTSVLKTTSWTDWADADTTVTVSEPQDTIGVYKFDHYDPSQSVTMSTSKTITLFYSQISALSVSISPTTGKIKVGESITFTSTVSGGEPAYNYQWYLNGSAVSGATSPTWTFAPTTQGSYIIYVNVTDNLGKTAKSNEASVTVAPKLVVLIFPTEALIIVGQSITFTSSVSGGYPPYTYQWYVDGTLQPLESGDAFTFKPSTSGVYYIYLKVTDSNSNTAQSETARVVVSTGAFGGHSVSLTKPVVKTPLICYTMLLAIFSVIISLIKRKRK